ncbi:MAG: DUF4199 domain-containing protein [Bacteroidia bacterium]|nr:DUF4199 domain-containing protein [Bacteroidia bacterium]
MEFTPIRPTALKYGPIIGIASAAYGIVLIATNQFGNTGLGLLAYVISIGGLVLTFMEYKKLNQGFMPFNTGFKLGFVTSFIASVVSVVISQVYTSLIAPGTTEKVLEFTRIKLEENPAMTEEAIDMTMGITEKMMVPYIAIPVGLVTGAIGAAIIALIMAAIMKKDPAQGA